MFDLLMRDRPSYSILFPLTIPVSRAWIHRAANTATPNVAATNTHNAKGAAAAWAESGVHVIFMVLLIIPSSTV